MVGMDLTDSDFDYHLFESLTSSSAAFLEFVHGHWDYVIHPGFVFQLQPLYPNLPPLMIYAERASDGKAKARGLNRLKDLK
jgi:hypothetical protein